MSGKRGVLLIEIYWSILGVAAGAPGMGERARDMEKRDSFAGLALPVERRVKWWAVATLRGYSTVP